MFLEDDTRGFPAPFPKQAENHHKEEHPCDKPRNGIGYVYRLGFFKIAKDSVYPDNAENAGAEKGDHGRKA